MKMKPPSLLLPCLIFLGLAAGIKQTAQGDWQLTIGNLDSSPIIATPGLDFLIPVYASTDTGVFNGIASFSFGIDVGTPAVASTYFSGIQLVRPNLPADDLFEIGPSGLSLGDPSNADDPSVVDFVVAGVFKSSQDFSTNKTKLFDISFRAPLSGNSGNYQISGVPDLGVSYFIVGQNLNDLTSSSFVNGSMQITFSAVPEPSSLALCCLTLGLTCFRTRRRANSNLPRQI